MMTDIQLMTRVAEEMRSEGWQQRPVEERLAEHERRYRAYLHPAPAPTLPEIVASLTGAPVEMAAGALAILQEAGQLCGEIAKWQHEVAELQPLPRCAGWSHVNKSGSMYIHHSTTDLEPCPLHGSDIKDRGRVYIGRKEDRQNEAIQALANQNAWSIACGTLADYEKRLSEIATLITTAVPGRVAKKGGVPD